MICCTTGGVRVTQHEHRLRTDRVRQEKGRGSGSPSCTSRRDRSRLDRASRGGVPVLKRRSSKPRVTSDAPSFVLGRSPRRPPGL